MGVVKTASESILEETVMPSEEANYSQQGYAVGLNPMERKTSTPRRIRCRDQGHPVRSLAPSFGFRPAPAQEFVLLATP
ncbi:hypothetical protein G5I_06001 [Acromyrmex echinatior]|uniref:Uncharacterized protein n=1 Tax=Acromyrmex echinatior TaxID=103372 RepID=F4WJW7_ACREC|nr:hypothetical protein G5I_06001 [Acromyrmex echinatior]